MYIVRFSDHIEEDIKRNWSSYNFGELGFKGTEEELEEAMASRFADEQCFDLSGFEIWEESRSEYIIRELYSGYWVVVDQNFLYGLACNELDAESLEEAIEEVTDSSFDIEYGEGDCVDCRNAKVVHSFIWDGNQTYILEVED